MAGKGSPNCCCVGCDSPPVMVPLPVTVPITGAIGIDGKSDPSPLPVQQLCLSCMPYQLCLRSDCNGSVVSSMLTRQDPCDESHTMSYWSGFVFYAETYVAIEIQFDIVDSQCFACVVSEGLGITGQEPSSRILLTWAKQSRLSPHCQDCVDEFSPSPVLEWTLSLGGYDCTLTATPVSHTSLTPTMPCDGCEVYPCAVEQPFYYDHALDEPRQSQCAICTGCSCISTYMCITVRQAGTLIENVQVKVCSFSWTTPLGTHISLKPADHVGGDDSCVLSLDDVGGFDFTGYSEPGVMTSSVVGQCPNISVTFAFTVTSESDPSDIKPFTITVASSECGECAALTGTPCCPGPVNRVLYATISGSDCSCEDLSIPIVETTIAGDVFWTGISDTDAFCAAWPTKCTVSIQLSCSGNNWILDLRYSTDGAPGYTHYTTYTGDCSPMNLVFTGINGHGKGDCGCAPPFIPKCNDFTVTITE